MHLQHGVNTEHIKIGHSIECSVKIDSHVAIEIINTVASRPTAGRLVVHGLSDRLSVG